VSYIYAVLDATNYCADRQFSLVASVAGAQNAESACTARQSVNRLLVAIFARSGRSGGTVPVGCPGAVWSGGRPGHRFAPLVAPGDQRDEDVVHDLAQDVVGDGLECQHHLVPP
jgi:hypothetical protein